MGLLNFLPEDPEKKAAMRAGLLQFGAEMLAGRGNFGTTLGQGLGAGVNGYSGSLAAQQKAQLDAMQAERWKMENDQTKAGIAEQGKFASIMQPQTSSAPQQPSPESVLVRGATPAPVGQQSTGGIASVSELPKVGGASPAAAPPGARPYTADEYRAFGDKYFALGTPAAVAQAEKLYKQADKMAPKLKEQRALMVDGKRVMVNVYEDGSTKQVDGFAPDAEKLSFHNTGGATVALDPFTGKPVQTIANSQSPDSVASGRIAIRGQNMVDARSKEANGANNRPPAGYRWNADHSAMEAIPGGPADKSAGGNMTEDQGKATGWLVQAKNAYDNMKAVGLDSKGNPTAAAKPGINDVIGSLPIIGGVANGFRTADRQKFIQSSESLSESLLRAATGAGVNKDEAAQKVRELTPLFGEDPSVTKQKFDAIPLYLETLKVRAGPGAKKAEKINSDGGGAPKVSSAADYAKLPSGAEYIDPNGKTRRKP